MRFGNLFGSKSIAIWRIEVEDFPAFIIIDDKGNDFFKELNLG
jgi:fumarate hydratase class I